MASAINDGSFVFSQEELKDFSRVIHELVYENGEISRYHEVETGVKYDQQIVFASKIGLMGKLVTGCTPNEIEGITLSEKKWQPVREDFRLKHCSADLNKQNKLVSQYSKMNPDFYDIIEGTQSPVGAFMVSRVLEALPENLHRKIWFSDKAADTVANGGSLKNGTDKEYFNTFDGLFKQMFINIPNTSDYYVQAPRNNGADYNAQKLQAGDAISMFDEMYSKMDGRLLSFLNNGLSIAVTRPVWDQYLLDLKDAQKLGGNTMMIENGVTTLFYNGIPIILREDWTRNIKTYYDNGTKFDKPNRAIATIAQNIPVATVAEDDFGTVEAFYDRVTKQNYIDGIYTIDAKHLENYLTVIAY